MAMQNELRESRELLELRILNGLQAGARLRLDEGQFLLGTSEECDVIINGRGVEPQAAEIEVRQGQILLSTLQPDFSLNAAASDLRDVELTAGQFFRLGDLWLAVDFAESPWPEFESWLLAPTADAHDDPAESAAAAADGDGDGDAAQGQSENTETVAEGDAAEFANPDAAKTTPSSVPWVADNDRSRVLPPPRQRRSPLRLALASTLILTGLAAIWTVTTTETSGSIGSSRSKLSDDVLTKVQRLLISLRREQLRLSESQRGDGLISGFLPTQSDIDHLDAQLKQIGVIADLKIHTDEALREKVITLLREKQYPVASTIVRDGHLVLAGQGIDAALAIRIETDLRNTLNSIGKITFSENAPESPANIFKRMLTKHQLADQVTIAVNPDGLSVAGELDSTEIRRFESLLLEFDTQYGRETRIDARITPSSVRLPFRVRQIVGGPQPYIVTTDDIRIYEGGEHNGYRLLSLRDHKVVFVGPKRVEFAW